MTISADQRRVIQWFRANPGSTLGACSTDFVGRNTREPAWRNKNVTVLVEAGILVPTGTLSARGGVQFATDESAIAKAIAEDAAWFEKYAPNFRAKIVA